MPRRGEASMHGKVTDEMIKNGVKVACTLPDTWLAPLITDINSRSELVHVNVTREESAIGVCFGAFFGGVRSVAVMGTSGLIASVYALTKLCMTYEVGVTLITNLRGQVGDPAGHHAVNGLLARDLLDCLSIPIVPIMNERDVPLLGDALRHTEMLGRPVAVTLPRPAEFGG